MDPKSTRASPHPAFGRFGVQNSLSRPCCFGRKPQIRALGPSSAKTSHGWSRKNSREPRATRSNKQRKALQTTGRVLPLPSVLSLFLTCPPPLFSEISGLGSYLPRPEKERYALVSSAKRCNQQAGFCPYPLSSFLLPLAYPRGSSLFGSPRSQALVRDPDPRRSATR